MKNLTNIDRQTLRAHDRGEIMAAWIYSHHEWKLYQLRRRQQLCRKCLWIERAGVWIATIYGRRERKIIILTSTGVLVHGKFRPFNTDGWQLAGIHIAEDAQPFMLRITCRHQTIGRMKMTNIFIPIPKGKLGEAVKVMILLEEGGGLRY
jgi:hypothetical protein